MSQSVYPRITRKIIEPTRVDLGDAVINLSMCGAIQTLRMNVGGPDIAKLRLLGRVSEVATAGENEYLQDGILEVRATVMQVAAVSGEPGGRGSRTARVLEASLHCRKYEQGSGAWMHLPEYLAAFLALAVRKEREALGLRTIEDNDLDWITYYPAKTPDEALEWLRTNGQLPGMRGPDGHRSLATPKPRPDGTYSQKEAREARKVQAKAQTTQPTPRSAPTAPPAPPPPSLIPAGSAFEAG